MNISLKFPLLVCLTLAGCVEAEQLEAEQLEAGQLETEEPDTATTEQAVGGYTHYDIRSFGGNIFPEDHYYVTPETCSPGYVRSTVGTRWTSQSGGHCAFQGWLTPGDPRDCRAMMLAHTGGGWFGGTCETWVTEVPAPGLFAYNATNTNSATTNTTNRTIALSAGQKLTIGTCGVPNSSASGDTYLRLYNPGGVAVAFSDDACGTGSQIVHTAATAGNFEVRAGCYSNLACGGTVAWFIQ